MGCGPSAAPLRSDVGVHDVRYTVFRHMLTEARIAQKKLQSDVAQALGKNQSFVSKYERGERRLDLPEFLEVADALGINVNEFIKKYREAVTKTR